MPSRECSTYSTSQLAGDVVLVSALAITCVNKYGCSAAAPVSFVNPAAQKRKAKAFDISSKLKAIEVNNILAICDTGFGKPNMSRECASSAMGTVSASGRKFSKSKFCQIHVGEPFY